jgi:hypothetical protein
MRVAIAGVITVLVCWLPSPVYAQDPGDRSQTIHPLLFDAVYDNITLDPTANVGPATRVEFTRNIDPTQITNPSLDLGFLIGVLEAVSGIDVPGWVIDFAEGVGDFSFVTLEPSFGPYFTARYGGYFQVQAASQAGLNLHTPVNIINDIPAVNSFKCGDVIAIHTSPQYRNDASLTVRPSIYDFELGPVFDDIEFGVQAGLNLSVCFGLPVLGECVGHRESFSTGTQKIGTTVPLPPQLDPMPPLINVCADAFRPGANEATLLSCPVGALRPFFNLGQDLLDTFNQTHGTNYTFAEFDPAQQRVTIMTPDLPTPLNFTLPEVAMVFQQPTPVQGVGALADGRLIASAKKTDLANASLDLVSLLEYAGIPTGLSLGGGLGSVDIGDVAPTFHIDQNMRYEFAPRLDTAMSLGVPMAFRIIDPVLGQVATGVGSTVNFTAGQSVLLSLPQAQTSPVSVSNLYSLSGTLNTQTSHQYRMSVQLRALKLNFPGFSFTALEKEFPLNDNVLPERPVENHTLDLGFNPVALPELTLDPEDPRISITNHEIKDTRNLGGGERAVVYTTTIKNDGDVNLSNVDLQLNLARIFGASPFQAMCIASPDLPIAASYNGTSNVNLLGATAALAPGQQGTVDVLVRVTPDKARINGNGCFTPVSYTSLTAAHGTTPIGTTVQNNLNQCTGDITGADILATANLGAAVVTDLEDYAIYASDQLVFDGTTGVSYGNVGAGGQVHVKRSGAAAPMQIVGDLHAGHQLHVQQSAVTLDYLQVHDKLHVDHRSSLEAIGGVSEDSDCVEELLVPDVSFMRVARTAPQLTIGPGVSMAVNPGDVRTIQVGAGGSALFRSGTYFIEDLNIDGNGATLVLNVSAGPLTLNIGSWRAKKVTGLRMIVTGGSSRLVRINYAGHGDLSFSNALLAGTILAPGAAVKLDEGSQLLGALHARRIEIGAGSTFRHHQYLEPLNIDPACQGALMPATTP